MNRVLFYFIAAGTGQIEEDLTPMLL